ncbi:uncharacterized protein BDR25DRAFT_347477 [Lindgomyces ingoldianus]|uniref:Uncharacterized protein n=1 Tax=Lindgomyces ingoldianus TaxID=673940 RepID=A0ACB6Q881_9PLEO|nr:uncharacterized protein BDR25DRAFT_347477 [Lindgomyces ingoldianus]KAF2463114.1 hypothetical protein BDR25DRAFT_347477 [Lindgomyces ingoldianus]
MGEEDIQMLEREYCPPIDPALIPAIYSDYAGTPNAIDSVRKDLDVLKEVALLEQSTGFDPSGTSGDAERASAGQQSNDAVSSPATSVSRTTTTGHTSLSNDISTLSLVGNSGNGSDGSLDGGCFGEIEQADAPTKELSLAQMFQTLRYDFVAYTLKKCNNDYSKATEELLNHVYFENSRSSPGEGEEGAVAKGIDAFAEEHHVPHRRKKAKGKGKKNSQASPPHSSNSSASISETDVSRALPTNKWVDGNHAVEFIASRTNLSTKTIASIYHSSGASISAAIKAIAEKNISVHQNEQEPAASLLQDAIELNADFPALDLSHAIALIRLSAPSTAAAHELAKAMLARPAASSTSTSTSTSTSLHNIEIIPKYAPLNLTSPDNSSSPSNLSVTPLTPSALPQTSATLLAARTAAFSQATTLYRKGKSTPLMKSAAGYYAQIGRDLNANLKAVNEADADALVDSQSSSTVLDLHGVSVASAVRIAQERVGGWWEGLGEGKILEYRGGRRGEGIGEGFRVVTGLGRHSEGGRGKLGPAVVRALVRGGWKVQVGSGEVLVVGRVRGG